MERKILSVLLAALLVIMFIPALPISATEELQGTGITSISEISDLTADYYLSADIGSDDAPNATTLGTFTGTLDGNGHAITTSVPLFEALGTGAAVKNLTINGSVSVSTSADNTVGILTKTISGTTALTNVVNNASLSVTAGKATNCYVGGLAATATAAVTLTDCVNNGALTLETCPYGVLGMGGLIGYTSGTAPITFTDCENAGTIWSKSTHGTELIGGIAGQLAAAGNCTFDSCKNSGTLVMDAPSNGGNKLGGLVSVCGKNTAEYVFLNCVNSADINTKAMGGGICADMRGIATYSKCINLGDITADASSSVNVYIGGIGGQCYNCTSVTIDKCANYGDVTANTGKSGVSFAAGIMGTSNKKVTVTDCANYGNITSFEAAGGIAGKFTVNECVFTRCMNFGTIAGTEGAAESLLRASIAANIAINNTDTTKFILIDSCYSVCTNAVGINAAATATTGNVKYVYADKSVETLVIGGTTTAECADNAAVFATYNEVFNANGYLTAENLKGQNAVENTSLSFGDVWHVKESYPVLAAVDSINAGTATPDETGIYFEGTQESTASDGKFNIRFVASVDNLNPQNVGFNIACVKSGDSTVLKTSKATTTVYNSIIADTDNGITAYSADSMSGSYIIALSVIGVPSEGTYTFVVSPTTTTDDVTSVANTYAVVYENGVYVTTYLY